MRGNTMEKPYHLSDEKLEKMVSLNHYIYTEGLDKTDNKDAINAGRRIAAEIAGHIKEYLKDPTNENRKKLFDNIQNIFSREWQKNPKLMWGLYGESSMKGVSRYLVSFAQDICGSNNPNEYLPILTGKNFFIMDAPEGKIWNERDLHYFVLFEMADSGHSIYVESYENTIKRVIEKQAILDPSDKEPLNKNEIIQRIKGNYEVSKILSNKEQFDPKKNGLTSNVVNALYNLAMSGDGVTADRPDDLNDRDNTIDNNFAEFVAMYTQLEETDPNAFKTMMNCTIGGSELSSRIPGIQDGSCAGTFKREIAKFLYEEVNISFEMQQKLKEQYNSTYEGKADKSSKHWVQKSDKILVNQINSHLDNSKGEAIDPQLIDLAQKHINVCKDNLTQAIKKISEINGALGKIPPLKEKKNYFSFFQKNMEVNDDFSINLERLKVSVTVLKFIVNDIKEFQKLDSYNQIVKAQPDIHDKFKKLLKIAAEGYEKLSEGVDKLSIDLTKKNSEEFHSQIKQDLESLKTNTYFAGLEIRSIIETSSLKFH